MSRRQATAPGSPGDGDSVAQRLARSLIRAQRCPELPGINPQTERGSTPGPYAPGMGRIRALVAGTIAACVLLVGCTSEDPKPAPVASVAKLGRSAVKAPEQWEGKVTIAAPKVTAPLVAETRSLLDAGLLVGTPLELIADQSLPDQGVTITRSYPAPLGEGMAATLAFFNVEAGGWQAVPSTLSSDRRTVSARVHHLSIWNDVLSGTQQSVEQFRTAAGDAVRAGSELTASELSAAGAKLADVADWMYYAVGKVFDTRVDAPSCEPKEPDWVKDVVDIEDNRNNPIRFCTGRDAKKPNLLVVKARVNRGFAFAAKPALPTGWRYNSTADAGLWDKVLPWLKANDAALRDTVLRVTGGDPSLAVGAGQELSFGLAEKDVRGAKSSTVVELHPPGALLFLTSVLAQLLAQDKALKSTGTLAAVLSVASCVTNVADADKDDPLAVAGAVLVCLQTASETITKLVVRAMIEAGAESAKTVNVAGVLTRASIYLALVGPLFSWMNWGTETKTLRSARTVDVYAKAIPKRVKTLVVLMDVYDSVGKLRSKYDVQDADVSFTGPLDCSTPSPASNGPAVFQCGDTAFDGAACWKDLQNVEHVLCLATPWETTLRRAPVAGSGVSDMTQAPVPLGVELVDGSRWALRLGGAWGNYGKNTVGTYWPLNAKAGDTNVLLKRDGEPEFLKATGTWSVLRGPDVGSNFEARDEAKRIEVAKVWFVTGRWQ